MNKAQLVVELSKKTKMTKKNSEAFLNAFIEIVKEELKNGGKVQLIGFGSFIVAERAARKVRNPRTGELLDSPAKKYPKFRPGKAFKEIVK